MEQKANELPPVILPFTQEQLEYLERYVEEKIQEKVDDHDLEEAATERYVDGSIDDLREEMERTVGDEMDSRTEGLLDKHTGEDLEERLDKAENTFEKLLDRLVDHDEITLGMAFKAVWKRFLGRFK